MNNEPLKIEITGSEELLKTFGLLSKGIDADFVMINAMKRIGKEVEANAKDLLQEKIYETPSSPYYVRTGLLRARTQSDSNPTKEMNGTLSISVRSKVHYAQYIEFGTSRMNARAFLMPAAEKTKGEISRILKDAIMDYLKSKGR